MRKLKVDKFKFYLKILSIILIINLIIGYFPRNLAIADTVINSDVDMAYTDISNAVDAIDTRKASDTNADYLGKVKFYDYYGSNKIGTIGNNTSESSNGYHYYFERFNKAVSDYSSENNIMYPLYFGDFNYAAGESNNPTIKPETGQTLMGSAYKFFWAANRASRSENSDTSIENSKYTASVQGLVSETLDNGKLIQDIKTINYAKTSSKSFNVTSVNCNSGTSYENFNSALNRNNVLKINYPGANNPSSKDYRVQLNTNDKDFSKNNKYLSFDVYNQTDSSGGSLFIALKDGSNRQIAGWIKFYGTEYYDNTMKSEQWQTVIVDLEELKFNDNNSEHGTYQPQNFNFSDVTSIFVGYWGKGGVFIDKSSIKFLGDIVEEKSGTVELPYFNSQFLSNSGVGTTTNEYEFPFKKRSKTVKDITGIQNVDADYYIFSSGKSGYQINNSTLTDVVRINGNHLDYWFDVADNDTSTIVKDMNGKDAGFGGTGDNEPGFFPFNTPTQGGKLDAPNSYTENGLNYGFGAKIEIQFKLTEDGTATTAERMQIPLEFNFKGDDDVWVYIDNQLALDMGGGHSQTEGNINFATGIATVKNVVHGKITSNSLSQPVVTKTKELKLPNDYYIDCDSSKGYDTDKIHTLTLFYMERGMIESNLYMDFNFIPSENELIVEKEVDTEGVNEVLASKTSEIAKDIQFKFTVFENDNAKTETEYVYSKDNSKQNTDRESGAFFLKDEETATFLNKFAEESKVHVTEEQDDRFTTSWRWNDIGKNHEESISGEGYKTSDVIIPKSQELFEKYTYHAIFTNKIKTENLKITKDIKLLEGDNLDKYKDDIFNFKVTFTSILGTALNPAINYNGKYYVSGEGIDGSVEKEAQQDSDGNWIIQLKTGQTAEIIDIPVNTEYIVKEILGDKYEIESITGGKVDGDTVTGEITVQDSEVQITYVNKKKLRDVQLIKFDSSDSNIKLEGAKFILNKLNENGDIDEIFEPREVISDKNGQASFVDLPYGKYSITEIEAPQGYELLKKPIEFEINDDVKNAVITIEVKNNKSIKLPEAGGNGNIISRYIGFMLIGLAVVLYAFVIIRNKKYKFN